MYVLRLARYEVQILVEPSLFETDRGKYVAPKAFAVLEK